MWRRAKQNKRPDVETFPEWQARAQSWPMRTGVAIRSLGESMRDAEATGVGISGFDALLPHGWQSDFSTTEASAVAVLNEMGFRYSIALQQSLNMHCDAVARCFEGPHLVVPAASSARGAVEAAALIYRLEAPELTVLQRTAEYAAVMYASMDASDGNYRDHPAVASVPQDLALGAGLTVQTGKKGGMSGFRTPCGYIAHKSINVSEAVAEMAPDFVLGGGAYRYLCDFTHGNVAALTAMRMSEGGEGPMLTAMVNTASALAQTVPEGLFRMADRLSVPRRLIEERQRALGALVIEGVHIVRAREVIEDGLRAMAG